MNCAVVTITGGASSALDGPGMFVANVGNGCGTTEGTDVVFPDPGSDIVYGGDAAKRAPPTGNCGARKTVFTGGGSTGSGGGRGPATGGGETSGESDAGRGGDTSGPSSSPGATSAAGAGGDTSGPSPTTGAGGAGGDTSGPSSTTGATGAAGARGNTSGPSSSSGGDTSGPSSSPGATGAGTGGYTKPILVAGGEYTSTAAIALPMSTGMTPDD
jgi:hypothetical protein